MKKCISMLLVLVMAWGITACQSVQVEESDDTQVENTQVHDAPMEMTEYQPIKEAKQTEAIDDNMELQTESKADRKSYYGSFEVVSYSAPGVSALPPEERVEYLEKSVYMGKIALSVTAMLQRIQYMQKGRKIKRIIRPIMKRWRICCKIWGIR